jgi:hypothetical protein
MQQTIGIAIAAAVLGATAHMLFQRTFPVPSDCKNLNGYYFTSAHVAAIKDQLMFGRTNLDEMSARALLSTDAK